MTQVEWNRDNDIHYLLGQLSMADEMIESFSGHARSKIGRKKLKELKDERQKVVSKINKLARNSIIIPNGSESEVS